MTNWGGVAQSVGVWEQDQEQSGGASCLPVTAEVPLSKAADPHTALGAV